MAPITPFFVITAVMAALLGGYTGVSLGKRLSRQRNRNHSDQAGATREEKLLVESSQCNLQSPANMAQVTAGNPVENSSPRKQGTVF
jgi:hypothetical protein